MTDRVSYLLAVMLLIIAAGFRLVDLATLPPGMTAVEIDNARIVETARAGTIESFYNLRGEGREPLYAVMVAATTAITGSGIFGYRLPSALLGMVTLALVYVLGKRLFGNLAALAALGLLAAGFFPALLDRAILPEGVLPLWMVATLLALAQSLSVDRALNARPPNSISFAALGLLLGLGFYIHPLHFPIVLGVMVFIAYTVLTRQPISRGALGYTSFGILVMIIVAMPYLIASLRQPELAGAGRVFAGTGQSILASVVNGLFGIFFRGDSNPALNIPNRPLFDLVSGFLIVLGLLVTLRGWRQPRYALVLIPLLFALPFALLSPAAPDFSRMAFILPLLALLFGAAVGGLSRRIRGRARWVLMAGLLALLAFNIIWSGRDLFMNWRAEPQVRAAYNARLGMLAHYLDATANDIPTVICTPELYPPDDAPQLISAQVLALMMHSQSPPLRYADCGSGLVLANGGERQQVIFPEVTGLQRVNPYIASWISRGGVLEGDNLPPQAIVLLDVSDALADTIGRFTTTAPATFAPEAGINDPIAETPVRFGGNIAFLGYDRVETDVFRPGAVIPVHTYWRVDGIVPTDLQLFTHLLSDPSVIAVQSATLSVRADLLQPRDVVIQTTFLQLPFTTPPGEYILSIGAYEQNRGTRLGVFDGDTLRGDRLFVGMIEISR
jgi:4-amino-4-deoxy-L-arabinose transferase-like glycosyltransferase